MRSLERIFTGLEITDAQKRQLAAWQLQEAAQDWWESVTAQTVEADISWDQFRYLLLVLSCVLFSFFSLKSILSLSIFFQGGFCGKVDARSREVPAIQGVYGS